MTPTIDFVGDHRCQLGESPVWDERIERLWWVDSVARMICRADAQGGDFKSWSAPTMVGSIALAEHGLLAALEEGFYAFDPDTGRFAEIALPEEQSSAVRFNDGKADRQGRFLAGTIRRAGQEGAPGKLYRLEPGGTATLLERDIRVANALCFSPAGDTLYFADSLARSIWAYDYDPVTGAVGGKRTLIDTAPLGSGADGATVDSDGNLWVALVETQALAIISPAGTLIGRIDLPIPFPSCPAFGASDRSTLFVTSIANSGGALHTAHPDGGRLMAISGHGATGLAEAICVLTEGDRH